MYKYKISICTVCMNRLHHIKKTLPANLLDNASYENIEFVLLDYGSTDGLYEWVKSELKDYIKKGILKYYYTSSPQYFDRSHSRNLMFRLASGDIICNVDADNYTGKKFAEYVNEIFSTQKDIYLVADTQKRYYFLRNAFGRFCVWKKDFDAVGGLDEKMKSYGSETLDFYQRLENAGKSEVLIEDVSFLSTISHGDEERISNEFFIRNLESLYIRYLSSEESELLILYKDNKFENCRIVIEKNIPHLPAALKPGTQVNGSWQRNNSLVELNDKCLVEEHDSATAYFLSEKEELFYKITDQKFLLQIAKNFSFITNTEQKEVNKNFVLANDGVFGRGSVLMNFAEEITVL